MFPLREPGPREINNNSAPPIKLLSNVEKLRLLTKAEKAGLLSAVEIKVYIHSILGVHTYIVKKY